MADNFRPTKLQKAKAKSRFDEVTDALAATNDFSSIIPRDVKEAGVRMETAPTSNADRPRAKTIGFNPNTNTLYIVFRDNTWWEYRNVPTQHWIGLQNAESTGRYLSKVRLGKGPVLDQWPDMGPADLSNMSQESKARMADNAAKADRIQLPTLDDYLFGSRG